MLEKINSLHPIRRSEEQKEAFRKWLVQEIAALGYSVRVEKNDKKHNNVVAGNPETAEAVITAHYDTPGCIGIPNLMIPRNWVVYYLYQLLVVGGMLAIALAVGLALGAAAQSQQVMLLGYFGVYMAILMFMVYGPANKHNVNDNTSGVAAALETMAAIPEVQRSKVAFIFFDNEEKGLKGSKAYAREHQEVQHTSLIVNMDCVGVGEHILLSVPALAKNLEQYTLLEQTLRETQGRTVHVFSSLTTRGNSDFRAFKCGVGISAYRMVKGVGFFTGRIHTAKDTEADPENLHFLAKALAAFAARL